MASNNNTTVWHPGGNSGTYTITAGAGGAIAGYEPSCSRASRPVSIPTKSRAIAESICVGRLDGGSVDMAEEILRAVVLNRWTAEDIAAEQEEAEAILADQTADVLRRQEG